MNPLDTLLALETPLNDKPRFPVEPPDDKRDWAEIDRQVQFRGMMRAIAPSLMVAANANAGKRNPRQALKEGIMAGVFDMTVASGMIGNRFVAWPEFKGWTGGGINKKGKRVSYRAGELSQSQIDWGNRMHDAGHHVACFFSPDKAVEWIRSIAPAAFIDRRGL